MRPPQDTVAEERTDERGHADWSQDNFTLADRQIERIALGRRGAQTLAVPGECRYETGPLLGQIDTGEGIQVQPLQIGQEGG